MRPSRQPRRRRRRSRPPPRRRRLASALPRASSTVLLVEGVSDRIAVETLAVRRGRDLAAEDVSVLPIGGAHAIAVYLERFAGSRLCGICDAGEAPIWQRSLGVSTREELERLGFFVCDADLEDELIRAVGAEAIEELFAAEGDLNAFRTFQKQPAWRGRPVEEQLRRFFGSADSRKKRYARILVEAVELERVPRPLDGVLSAA